MNKYLIIALLSSKIFAIDGYLYQNGISDCQDPCSQYFIESELYGDFETIPITFQNPNINIDLYMNRFVTVELGQEVTCVECNAFEVLDINLSQDCEFPVACFVDPCMVDECLIDTPVDCISNYCGGCHADFYDLEGNLVDCNTTNEECFDFTGIDFGVCTMVLGVGFVNGECNYVSGCDWTIDGIDYSYLFFENIEECEEACDIEFPIELGDVNFDGDINILDVVLLVSFILGDPTNEYEYIAGDINQDSLLNVLDIILLIEMIFNPENLILINSGTSYGECWGYCVFELELDNSNAVFTVSSMGNWYDEFLDLLIEDNLSTETWLDLIDLVDFEYFQSLDDVYGCPDCADGGAEFIEIIYDGVSKQVTFEAYSEIDGIQELTILLRDIREDYWNQINENQGCYLIPEIGPCDGACPTYFYNQHTNECEEYIFGCCGPEAFGSMEDCQNACE